MSVHVYEKRSVERVGRGKRREAIAELLKTGVNKLETYSNPWLLQVMMIMMMMRKMMIMMMMMLQVMHGAMENSECLVFVSERVIGTLSTILASQHGHRDYSLGKYYQWLVNIFWFSFILLN